MNDLRQSTQPDFLGKRISRSNDNARDRSREIAREQSGDHGAQAKPGQVRTAFRGHSADSADLDGNAGEISKPAEGVSCQSKTARLQSGFGFCDCQVAKELVEDNSLAQGLSNCVAIFKPNAH